MGPNPYVAILWAVGFVVIVVLVFSSRRRRRRMPGSGATGAVWDLLNEDKRRAIEIIVEQRAEARDPEDAEGNKPDLDDPVERTAFARLESEGWQRVAGRYQDTFAGLTIHFVPALLDAGRVAKGVRVLDVACGPGGVAEAASERGATATGLDFSSEMISIARARCPEIDFRIGNAESLPFSDAEFDAVLMNFGVLHLPEPERAFSEAARVLRPGGRYALTVWAGPEECPGARIVQDAVATYGNRNAYVPQGPDRLRHGEIETWRHILNIAGFDPESVRVDLIRAEWELPTDFFLFEAERHAGVRTAALLAAQTPQALDAINDAITRSVQGYARNREFAVPYAAYVVSACRPA
jgi:ubiquinone/menaquinone biosynthesis C-methylase UbiE